MKNCQNRIGETRLNATGEKMTILYYKNSRNIDVIFENGYIKNTNYASFKIGYVKNDFYKSVCNNGMVGYGDYIPKINNEHTRPYVYWREMIRRCYGELRKRELKNKNYEKCYVGYKWKNFQNFGKWFDENYYEINGQTMNLDKDLLVRNNHVYSAKKCVFLPQDINKAIMNNNNRRGKYPLGVSFNKSKNAFQVACSTLKEVYGTHIGTFYNSTEAFYAYKKEKEKRLKELADSYHGIIPDNAYQALMNWEINITD